MSETSSKPFEQLTPEYQRIHSLIDGLLDYWLEKLGLQTWGFESSYYPVLCEEQPAAAASASSSWEYMQGHIKFFLPKLIDLTDREIEFIIVHELCHPIVSHMRAKKLKRKLEEKTVTMLAKGYMRVKYSDSQAETPLLPEVQEIISNDTRTNS